MFRLLLLLFLFSCSNLEDPTSNSSIQWVENLSITKTPSELYIQAELSKTIELEIIDSLLIDLEYIGDSDLEYIKTLKLYDDGADSVSGDLIANNGIYTLISHPDSLIEPEDPLSILSINFPTSKMINQVESDTIEFSIRTNGNLYSTDINIFNNGSIIHNQIENININNTKLEIFMDKSSLMVDNLETEECDRYLKYEGLDPVQLDYNYSDPIIDNANLKYESSFFVDSMDNCATTGDAIFTFRLTKIGDNLDFVEESRTIVIYGCGDNICTPVYENINSCSEDCFNE